MLGMLAMVSLPICRAIRGSKVVGNPNTEIINFHENYLFSLISDVQPAPDFRSGLTSIGMGVEYCVMGGRLGDQHRDW